MLVMRTGYKKIHREKENNGLFSIEKIGRFEFKAYYKKLKRASD